jgi:hypothetical protein
LLLIFGKWIGRYLAKKQWYFRLQCILGLVNGSELIIQLCCLIIKYFRSSTINPKHRAPRHNPCWWYWLDCISTSLYILQPKLEDCPFSYESSSGGTSNKPFGFSSPTITLYSDTPFLFLLAHKPPYSPNKNEKKNRHWFFGCLWYLMQQKGNKKPNLSHNSLKYH